MSKKLKYQITERSYILMDVDNEQEEKFVRIMNNEMDKQKKRNRTYRKHCLSLESYMETTKIEPAYQGEGLEEVMELEFIKQTVADAIKKLPKKQRETINAVYYDEKSLREIARERGQDISTVRESYKGAVKRLKELLKNI